MTLPFAMKNAKNLIRYTLFKGISGLSLMDLASLGH
jgi:hypothetical protein